MSSTGVSYSIIFHFYVSRRKDHNHNLDLLIFGHYIKKIHVIHTFYISTHIYRIYFDDLLINQGTGVPLTMYPWYLLSSLGIVGDDDDNTHINTHFLGLRDFPWFPFGGTLGSGGTTNYPSFDRGRWPTNSWACLSAAGGVAAASRCDLVFGITPWKMNGWNLQITYLERKMIFQTSMIVFHVNLQGCIRVELEGFFPCFTTWKTKGLGWRCFWYVAYKSTLMEIADAKNYVGLRAVGFGILIFVNINQYLQDFAGTWPCAGLIPIREDTAKCILDNLNGGISLALYQKRGSCAPMCPQL